MDMIRKKLINVIMYLYVNKMDESCVDTTHPFCLQTAGPTNHVTAFRRYRMIKIGHVLYRTTFVER